MTTEEPPEARCVVMSIEPTGQRRLVKAPGRKGKWMFESFRGSLFDKDRRLTVFMEVAVPHMGAPRLAAWGFEADPTFTLKEAKDLPLDVYLRVFVDRVLFNDSGETVRKRLRRGDDDDDTNAATAEDVATWHREAEELGLPAGPYIAEMAQTTHGNARQMILAARKAGFLPPSRLKRSDEWTDDPEEPPALADLLPSSSGRNLKANSTENLSEVVAAYNNACAKHSNSVLTENDLEGHVAAELNVDLEEARTLLTSARRIGLVPKKPQRPVRKLQRKETEVDLSAWDLSKATDPTEDEAKAESDSLQKRGQ